MDQAFNQFSYPILSILFLLGLGIILTRIFRLSRRQIFIILIPTSIILITGYFVLRPGQSDVASLSEAQIIIKNGQPTFVEFFSNYCTSCLLIRPSVDQKISEIREDFNIIRVDIHTDTGRALRDAYGFTYTPEFLLIDNTGEIQWRGNILPDDEEFEKTLN